jgi:hypothetical protein
MGPALRKTVLTTHIVTSVGWLGATVGILALAVAGVHSADVGSLSAAYHGTELIWRFVVLPFSFAALVTGLVAALGSPWGLFKHYWVLTKFLVTAAAIALLLLHTKTMLPALMAQAAEASSVTQPAGSHHGGMDPKTHLVVAATGTTLLLLFTTALSVFKPWGRIGRVRSSD